MLENLFSFIQENEWLMAGIGVGGFGLLSFWIKDVPLKLFGFLKRQLTTDLIIANSDEVFYELLKFIQQYNRNRKFRTFKLNNGRWGSNVDFDLSLGYGTHLIWYKRSFLFINYTKEKESLSSNLKEIIVLTKLGRSRKLFDDMIQGIKDTRKQKKDTIAFHKMGEDCWCFIRDLKKRPFKTLFIEKQKKDLILNSLNKFTNKEQWYINSGIPYQLGILLYGSPGTGKTSLIKCLASHLNYAIYYLSPSKLGSIEKAFSTISEKSIIVIEDIDTNSIVSKRTKKGKSKEQTDIFEGFSLLNLSDILNSLDGLANVHGRILIGTTNHIKTLDKALIRPGRFDLLLELNYVNKEVLKQFFDHYYPKDKINYNTLKLKNNISVAELQQMVLQEYTYKNILKKIIV
jgi:chaperone BCS1